MMKFSDKDVEKFYQWSATRK